MSANILIVDDEKDIRMLVSGVLQDEGYSTLEAGDSDTALSLAQKERPDLVILDIWLEGSHLDGIEILKKLKEDNPFLPVIMMSGHGNIATAVSSIKVGAYDFIEKPFKSDRLLLVVQRALEATRLKRENEDLRQLMFGDEELIGNSLLIQNLRQMIDKAAPTSSRIFITGASGSGKELVAKQIHLKSGRREYPFAIVNCAALTEERADAELFGEESGGQVIHTGILEKADGGTVLLDEIVDMPIGIQSKLIRLMQEMSFERLHGAKKIKSNIRFIASTTKDIAAEIKNGKIREDLYYRLNVVPIRVPPLKERKDDIIPLIDYFMGRFSELKSTKMPTFADDALAVLQAYDWPGNVRQLRNVLEWLTIINPDADTAIHEDMLPAEITLKSPDSLRWDRSMSIMSLSLKEAREVFEKEYIEAQMKRFGDNISRTAKFVGMERSALYRKLKSLGIEVKRRFSEEEEASEE